MAIPLFSALVMATLRKLRLAWYGELQETQTVNAKQLIGHAESLNDLLRIDDETTLLQRMIQLSHNDRDIIRAIFRFVDMLKDQPERDRRYGRPRPRTPFTDGNHDVYLYPRFGLADCERHGSQANRPTTGDAGPIWEPDRCAFDCIVFFLKITGTGLWLFDVHDPADWDRLGPATKLCVEIGRMPHGVGPVAMKTLVGELERIYIRDAPYPNPTSSFDAFANIASFVLPGIANSCWHDTQVRFCDVCGFESCQVPGERAAVAGERAMAADGDDPSSAIRSYFAIRHGSCGNPNCVSQNVRKLRVVMDRLPQFLHVQPREGCKIGSCSDGLNRRLTFQAAHIDGTVTHTYEPYAIVMYGAAHFTAAVRLDPGTGSWNYYDGRAVDGAYDKRTHRNLMDEFASFGLVWVLYRRCHEAEGKWYSTGFDCSIVESTSE